MMKHAKTRLYLLLLISCWLLQSAHAQDDALTQLNQQRQYLVQFAGDSLNTATIYNNMGVMFHMLQQYDSSEYYHLQALAIRERLFDSQHPDYRQSIDNLSAMYSASSQSEKLINFCRQHGDTLNLNYINALHNQASEHYHQADYDAAADLMHIVLRLREQAQGELHPDYASSLNLLAMLEQEQNHYSQAEQLYQQALRLQKQALGKHHPEYISTLNNLSTLYYMQGDYAAAAPLMQEALTFRKREFGSYSPEYAASLNQMAALYHALGDYAAAVKIAQQSLDLTEHLMGKDNDEYAHRLANLGEIYQTMGEYQKAEPMLKEACERTRKVLGNGHPDYALCLNNLASLYQTIGDYESAKPLLNEVLWIKKQTLGTRHADYALALLNMASVYASSGNLPQAEPLYREAAEVSREVYGSMHPEYAVSLNNLATLLINMERYDEAEPLLQEAMTIRKNVLGETHPDYAMSINNMAVLYCNRHDYATAEQWQRKALTIYQHQRGQQLHGYTQILYNLGTICFLQDKMTEAEALYRKVFELSRQEAQKMFCFMSERQRDLYWAQNNMQAEVAYPTLAYKYRFQKPEIAAFAYDNELYLKGLLLNTTMQLQNAITHSGDSVLTQTFRHLKAVKEQIIHLRQQTSPSMARLDSLQLVAEQLDKQLVQSSQLYSRTQQSIRVDWQQVRSALRDHDVAIEFSSFWLNVNGSMEKHNIALVLRDKSAFPLYVDLGREEDIAAHLSTSPGDTYDEINGAALYRQIWEPILPYLMPGDTVYFAPAGILHQLNLAALPVSDEQVIGDLYDLRRISSTRNLAAQPTMLDAQTLATSGAVLFGGVDYGQGTIPYLAGTLHEVQDIQSQLQQKSIPVTLSTGARASEEAFKDLSQQTCGLLHIATHGFFYANDKLAELAYFRQQWQVIGDNSTTAPVDPLMRAGLMLANANSAWSGTQRPTDAATSSISTSAQDGILTAKEIALIDLSQTQLVVMSACETGRGEVTSEGVFGLQRAFKQAGANSLIMSLWKVNDQATALMMTTFYQHLLSGLSPRLAFRQAQQTVRQDYPEPYFWAAFILVD